MMRAVPRAAEVAQLLGQALATSGGTAMVATALQQPSPSAGHRGVASPVLT